MRQTRGASAPPAGHGANRWLGRGAAVLSAVAVLALSVALPVAEASFPGTNGRIVFSGYRDGEQRLWTMNSDGTTVRRLTDNEYPVIFREPQWSADGSKVVMVDVSGSGDYPHIWTVRADGSGLADLGPGQSPAWSPDGQRIAFTFFWDVCIMDADGSDRACFVDDNADDHPSWSPDGSRLVYSRVYENHWDLVTMNVDGTDIVNVTNDALEQQFPDWSPDGSRIVYTVLAPEGQEDIWTIRVDGTGATNLTPDDAWDTYPDWSPDGTKIVFKSHRDLGLFVMNADGTDLQRLTYDDDWDPDWSSVPDLPVEPAPVELTLDVGHVPGRAVLARGGLWPPHVGESLKVTLFRRVSGAFERIDRRRTTTDEYSGYLVRFPEPPRGRCRFVVRWGGDADHLAARVSERFPCVE